MPNVYVNPETYDKLVDLRTRYESQVKKETGKLSSVKWSTIITDLLEDAQKFREAQGE